MQWRRTMTVAALGLGVAFSAERSRGDDGEVSPPPVPAAQLPGPARTAPDPPQGWMPPLPKTAPVAPAAMASPQVVASPQMMAVPMVASPAPAAPQTIT